MLGLLKHVAWAAALTGCISVAAIYDWSPLSLRLIWREEGASPNSSRPVQTANAVNPANREASPARDVIAPVSATAAQSPTALPPTIVSNASIDDPAAAAQILAAIGQLDGIVDSPVGTEAQKTVIAFFDPRCRYCHAAFTTMSGKIAMRWIPVIALDNREQGIEMASSILAAPDKLSAMRQAFEGKALPKAADPALVGKLQSNFEHYASIMAAAPNLQRGVPLFFVPRPNGRVAILVGYEQGDDKKITDILSGAADG